MLDAYAQHLATLSITPPVGGNRYRAGDAFLFGPETRGLPAQVLRDHAGERGIRLPMLPDSRSLNLSNAVAVVIYESLRQLDFGACI